MKTSKSSDSTVMTITCDIIFSFMPFIGSKVFCAPDSSRIQPKSLNFVFVDLLSDIF